MRIFSSNEWDSLKSVIVGDADYANWPRLCPDFRHQEETTLWKETQVPSGPVDPDVIREAGEDLNKLADFLVSQGVTVYRPLPMDFQKMDGMYNYCPRDRLLVVGDTVIDAPMAYACRKMEIDAYHFLNCEYVQAAGKFDAANVCRLNDDLIYLVGVTGDAAGAEWLQDYFCDSKRIWTVDHLEGVSHIDSTIVPVREGLVVLNASRLSEDTVPGVLKNWDKIWVHDMVPQPFKGYPYASKWIGMNFLVVNPTSAVCDPKQSDLRRELDKHGVDTHGIDLRHSRTLGGGHHCVTLDLIRK